MHYISEKWRDILIFNNLDTHQKIWALEVDWFEEPNYRRGGWSGVSRIELQLPEGGTIGVFMKRQEDHVTPSFLHPFKGISTFLREFQQIKIFNDNGIPSLDVLYFENWQQEGHQRAVILTKELAGYIPLSSEEFQSGGKFVSSKKQKLKLFNQLAQFIQNMHSKNFQHNCFYLKHIFALPLENNEIDLVVIDLEKANKCIIKRKAIFRDLYTLNRHAGNWSIKDRLRFYQCYQNEKKLSKQSKELWREIAKRTKEKSKH